MKSFRKDDNMENTYDKQAKTIRIVLRTLFVANVIVYGWILFLVIDHYTVKETPIVATTTNSIKSATSLESIKSENEDDLIIKHRNKNSDVKRTVTLSRGGDITIKKPINERDIINVYIKEICVKYNMDPYLIMSMIVSESNYNPRETTGICLGLMQISTKWHKERASRLGVTNFYDPYSNILLGVDYLSELFKQYKDPRLVLMLYNMNHDIALSMYKRGEISYYARSVLARADEYRKGE